MGTINISSSSMFIPSSQNTGQGNAALCSCNAIKRRGFEVDASSSYVIIQMIKNHSLSPRGVPPVPSRETIDSAYTFQNCNTLSPRGTLSAGLSPPVPPPLPSRSLTTSSSFETDHFLLLHKIYRLHQKNSSYLLHIHSTIDLPPLHSGSGFTITTTAKSSIQTALKLPPPPPQSLPLSPNLSRMRGITSIERSSTVSRDSVPTKPTISAPKMLTKDFGNLSQPIPFFTSNVGFQTLQRLRKSFT